MNPRWRSLTLAGLICTTAACGTEQAGAPGSSSSATTAAAASSAARAIQDQPVLRHPSSVTTSSDFTMSGKCPMSPFGIPTAMLEYKKDGIGVVQTALEVDAAGTVRRTSFLGSQDFQTDTAITVVLSCSRWLDKNGVRTATTTTSQSVQVDSTYRAATFAAPSSARIGGRIKISGKCPYPGARAQAYFTDRYGPATQVAFPVAGNGVFDAELIVPRTANTHRPSGRSQVHPGLGSIAIGCSAGRETSVGPSRPLTFTGTEPEAPPASKATLSASPSSVRTGEDVRVTVECPAGTWHVEVTFSDAHGTFAKASGPPNGTRFGAAIKMERSLNYAQTHPDALKSGPISVKGMCNRLPSVADSEIFFAATATITLR